MNLFFRKRTELALWREFGIDGTKLPPEFRCAVTRNVVKVTRAMPVGTPLEAACVIALAWADLPDNEDERSGRANCVVFPLFKIAQTLCPRAQDLLKGLLGDFQLRNGRSIREVSADLLSQEKEATATEAAAPADGDLDHSMMAATTAMRAAHSVWESGLTPDEKEKPEAAAVLQGMFDSIAQLSSLDHKHALAAFCGALGRPGQQVTPNMTNGDLLNKALRSPSNPTMLPWVRYAGNKIKTGIHAPLNATDAIIEIIDAVKAGRFDPSAPLG